MKPFFVGVSSACEAEAVYSQGAVPVFALRGLSFSGLDEATLSEIDRTRPYGVLMNRLFREGELSLLEKAVNLLSDFLPECVYYADPAVLAAAGEKLRSRLVYRPETLMTNREDIRFWLDAGIRAVSVSPLLTAEELYAAAETEGNTEYVIHGHLMMSVSARKLLRSWAEQYDVILPEDQQLYLREEKRSDHYPIKETAFGTMIFTDYVLESFDYIRSLAEHGAGAFYLDGAFMKQEDLIEALRLYQAVLNGTAAPEEIASYRLAHPECAEGYYGQETIL